jgi:hypothetical protein
VYIKIVEVPPMNLWSKKRSVMRRYDLTAQMYDQRYGEEQEAKYKAALAAKCWMLVVEQACFSTMYLKRLI